MATDSANLLLKKKPSMVSMVTLPMDGLTSWLVCTCSAFAGLICCGIGYTYGLFFPLLLDEFQAGKAKTAVAGSLTFGVLALVSPMSAKLCNRFGCRLMIVCGGLTCVLGLIGSAFAPNLYVLYMTYGILVGSGSSLIFIASFQIVPLYFDKHRSVATAMVSGGSAAGLLVMSPVVQVLLDHYDWRKAFMVLAGINVIPSILGCSITRRNTNSNAIKELPSRKNLDVPLFKEPKFVLATVFVVTAGLGHLIPSVHLAKYAQDLDIPRHLASWLYFAIGSASVVSRLFAGRLCDTGWCSLIRIFQFGVVTFAVADFLVPLATTFTSLLIYSLTFGMCEGMYTTPMYCFILHTYNTVGLGWYISFQVINQFFAPVLAGLIADMTGSYHPAFYTAGGLLLLAACMSLLMPFFQTSDKEEVKGFGREEVVIFERETVC